MVFSQTSPKIVLMAFAMFFTLVSCENGEQKLKRKPLKPKKTLNVEKDSIELENWVIYRTPGTAEQSRAMKKFMSTYNSKLVYGLNPIDTLSIDKSLVLGVLLSDLSYCRSFGRKKEGQSILKKIKILQSQLNIVDSSFQLLPKKMANQKIQSELDFAANNAYSNSIWALREQKQWTDLTKVKLGSWVQTMHISLNSRKNTKKKKELLEFLITQKIVTENLLYSLIEEGDDHEIDFFSNKLTLILEHYDQLFIEIDSVSLEKKEGFYVLSGNRTMIANEVVFDEIAKVVDILRNEIGNYGKN